MKITRSHNGPHPDDEQMLLELAPILLKASNSAGEIYTRNNKYSFYSNGNYVVYEIETDLAELEVLSVEVDG